jgi:hypothetical protein
MQLIEIPCSSRSRKIPVQEHLTMFGYRTRAYRELKKVPNPFNVQ